MADDVVLPPGYDPRTVFVKIIEAANTNWKPLQPGCDISVNNNCINPVWQENEDFWRRRGLPYVAAQSGFWLDELKIWRRRQQLRIIDEP